MPKAKRKLITSTKQTKKFSEPAGYESYRRITPMGFEHAMNPFFVGLAAAEFMDADPYQWIKLAVHAGLRFTPCGAGFAYDPNSGDPDLREFLVGLMCGTPGGKDAIGAVIARDRLSTWGIGEEGDADGA